jgi:hypothetical protein
MAITANATTLTFNNGSTQTVAPVNTNANVNSVSAGTGISVSATTGALTVTNSGVTSVTGAGTVSVSASTGGVTITGTGGSGTVTSVATGNGLQGGTITSTGTLSVACPGFNTVGSYCTGFVVGNGSDISRTSGTNYSAGSGNSNIQSGASNIENTFTAVATNNLSGTWKWMAGNLSGFNQFSYLGLVCRVS